MLEVDRPSISAAVCACPAGTPAAQRESNNIGFVHSGLGIRDDGQPSWPEGACRGSAGARSHAHFRCGVGAVVAPNSSVSVITTARRWMAAYALLVPCQPGDCFSSRDRPGPASQCGRPMAERPAGASRRPCSPRRRGIAASGVGQAVPVDMRRRRQPGRFPANGPVRRA
jgi:hypothetical protein